MGTHCCILAGRSLECVDMENDNVVSLACLFILYSLEQLLQCKSQCIGYEKAQMKAHGWMSPDGQ